MNQKPSEGRTITVKLSERTKKKVFLRDHNHKKETFPAVITEVNDKTVDLTIHGVRETAYVSNIPHASETTPDRSSWDWPKREE